MKFFLSLFFVLISLKGAADPCGEMEIYDVGMQMCMPLPMKDMSMAMLMIQGNGFFTGVSETGPRGRTAFAIPHFFMADLGHSMGDFQYLNLDYMGTLERWTIPDGGYPELLQIGEENNQGTPYLDAQHPHSSPIMGLTLSDTLTFGTSKDYLKLFVAPRGEATDGPVPFMHRTTGIVNPDAPLGHHIGQDVGHLTSTVVGESLKIKSSRFEFSTYHGTEPKPQNVDLPLGSLDSYSFRFIQEINSSAIFMMSYAYVTNPEAQTPSVENRYSASLYNKFALSKDWSFDNSLIWGAVSGYDSAATLTSFGEEFLFSDRLSKIWSRLEILQRTPEELQIATSYDQNAGQWVSALTLGFTQRVANWDNLEMGLGVSVTTDFLPQDFQSSYSGNPWAGKLFLQLSGSKMWNL